MEDIHESIGFISAWDENAASIMKTWIQSNNLTKSDRENLLKFGVTKDDKPAAAAKKIVKSLQSGMSARKGGMMSSSGREPGMSGGRARSFSLEGVTLVDDDAAGGNKTINAYGPYGASLEAVSNMRKSARDSNPVHDYGTVEVKSGPMTIASKPLVDYSALSGPYACPETPERVFVDGMYVVSGPDDVRDFYVNGDVMVMRIIGGSSKEDDKDPTKSRCKALDIYRKCIQKYEQEFNASRSMGNNLVRWTFYYDNGYKTEDEQDHDDEPWLKEKKNENADTVKICLSRFDGRDNYGYVMNRMFTYGDPSFPQEDLFNQTNCMRFLKREYPFEVFAHKIVKNNDIIRFVEKIDEVNSEGMKAAAKDRLKRYLNNDQTIVIFINIKVLEQHGYDAKFAELFNIVNGIQRQSQAYRDRIAYYFYNRKLDNDIKAMYKSTGAFVKVKDAVNDAAGKNATPQQIQQISDGTTPTVTNADLEKYMTGNRMNGDEYNMAYNGASGILSNTNSSTALFQIVRGSRFGYNEMYVVKSAPSIEEQAYPLDGDNALTERLNKDLANIQKIPFVTSSNLTDFMLRQGNFPVAKSSMDGRQFYVQQLEKSTTSPAGAEYIYNIRELPEDVMAELKSGRGILLYYKCNGLDSSCCPPQLENMAEAFGLRLFGSTVGFDTAHGHTVVGLRSQPKVTHAQHDIFIFPGNTDRTNAANQFTSNENCKKVEFKNLNMKGLYQFFQVNKLLKKNFAGSTVI